MTPRGTVTTVAPDDGDKRPRALDLYCGAGGVTKGLQRAGFHVTGIDINPQPNYCGDGFVQMDVMALTPRQLCNYKLVWASPPCQKYSAANNIHQRTDHPDLVAPTRELLRASGAEWVIENVPGAPLIEPFTLCGLTFGLGVKRHRIFEASFPVLTMPCPKGHPGDWVCVFGHTVLERSPQIGRTEKNGPRFRRRHLGTDVGREAMGISWMNRAELSQAIPPAYSEYIGNYALASIARRAAA